MVNMFTLLNLLAFFGRKIEQPCYAKYFHNGTIECISRTSERCWLCPSINMCVVEGPAGVDCSAANKYERLYANRLKNKQTNSLAKVTTILIATLVTMAMLVLAVTFYVVYYEKNKIPPTVNLDDIPLYMTEYDDITKFDNKV